MNPARVNYSVIVSPCDNLAGCAAQARISRPAKPAVGSEQYVTHSNSPTTLEVSSLWGALSTTMISVAGGSRAVKLARHLRR